MKEEHRHGDRRTDERPQDRRHYDAQPGGEMRRGVPEDGRRPRSPFEQKTKRAEKPTLDDESGGVVEGCMCQTCRASAPAASCRADVHRVARSPHRLPSVPQRASCDGFYVQNHTSVNLSKIFMRFSACP